MRSSRRNSPTPHNPSQRGTDLFSFLLAPRIEPSSAASEAMPSESNYLKCPNMAFHKSKPSSPKYQTLISRSIVSFCFLLLFVQVSTSVTSRFFSVLLGSCQTLPRSRQFVPVRKFNCEFRPQKSSGCQNLDHNYARRPG